MRHHFEPNHLERTFEPALFERCFCVLFKTRSSDYHLTNLRTYQSTVRPRPKPLRPETPWGRISSSIAHSFTTINTLQYERKSLYWCFFSCPGHATNLLKYLPVCCWTPLLNRWTTQHTNLFFFLISHQLKNITHYERSPFSSDISLSRWLVSVSANDSRWRSTDAHFSR